MESVPGPPIKPFFLIVNKVSDKSKIDLVQGQLEFSTSKDSGPRMNQAWLARHPRIDGKDPFTCFLHPRKVNGLLKVLITLPVGLQSCRSTKPGSRQVKPQIQSFLALMGLECTLDIPPAIQGEKRPDFQVIVICAVSSRKNPLPQHANERNHKMSPKLM